MGRLHNYTINPSQEVVALGAANLASAFMGGWVCTGSFAASAVLCKAGVRTPLSGLFTAIVLVLALYVLTSVFYFIPTAALAGIVMHAVYSLIASPRKVYNYWKLSPVEFCIWVVCVVLAVFMSLEASIYAGIGLSLILLLLRLARTQGAFIGQLKVEKISSEMTDEEGGPVLNASKGVRPAPDVFLPLERTDGTNPNVRPRCPYPGVFIYRFNEGYNYINQAHHVDRLLTYAIGNTRRASEEHFEKESDRLWNDPGTKSLQSSGDSHLPLLRCIVLDFGAVNVLDITSVQGLVDMRKALDHHAAPGTVEWHFANVHNRWTRRALATAGFGVPTRQAREGLGQWSPLYNVAVSYAEKGGIFSSEKHILSEAETDEESGPSKCPSPPSEATEVSPETTESRRYAAIDGVNRPFFHVDLPSAVESAVRDARRKDGRVPGA